MDYDNSKGVELGGRNIYKGKIYIFHNQLEQIRFPRQEVMDRIPLEPKTKKNSEVQAIWKEKETKHN